MTLKRVHLELARDHDHPAGSKRHGYEFIAPLDNDGHIVTEEWKTMRKKCRVHRFVPGEKDQYGNLVHKPGGAWAFDYDATTTADDEKGFKFDKHRFVPGEYVSITEHDGVMRTFFIKAVVDED